MRTTPLYTLLFLAGCTTAPTVDPGATATDLECQIKSPAEKTPGYPYDLPTFRASVLPTLVKTCAAAGCHGAPAPVRKFVIWADAAPGNCSYAKTFNSLQAQVDLGNPANSAVYRSVVGDMPGHPLTLGKDNADVKSLLAFIEGAARTQNGGGGGVVPPPVSANPYDYAVFQAKIQPMLDNADGKGCSASGCHGGGAVTGFSLKRAPAANSPDMEANFNAVTARSDYASPDTSGIYLRATVRHAAGASALLAPAEAKTLFDWMKAATANVAPGGNAQCPPASNFDEAVFRDEVLPILLGTIDLNNRNDTRTNTGCARAACHGQDRQGGALVIKATNTPLQNLASFACFANLTSPTASEILVCPLDQPGCRHNPHPGQVVFSDANDLNYQKVLSFIYGAKTVATPLDFAFFARRINPLFNDVTAVAAGTNRTCADASCHGISLPGQAPPNGSNLGILANATDKARLLINFSQASNFTNFINPLGSSLFLYPTNEISNLANRFATGLPHPGGLDFAADSVQARQILAWAGGLRPDGNGLQPNWLVAGDYAGSLITDVTVVDELRSKPAIFDRSGAPQFNNGEWDGLFSDNGIVDLNVAFPRAVQNGRIAYAVAYVINTTSSDIQGDLTIVSPNAVKLYVADRPVFQANDAQNGVTGLATLPAFVTSRSATRILVKVLQRPGDRDFQFQMFMRDGFGNPLTNLTGELVLKLSPDGGI